MLRARSPGMDVATVDNVQQIFATSAGSSTPDILIIEAPAIDASDFERLERLSQIHPRIAFIMICPQNSPEFLMQAMRAGVREVLASPIQADVLDAAIQRLENKQGHHPESDGKVLAFISCKGGSGATFLATNLGYALATLKNKRVALIDLNLQFGDASLFVSDQKPQATISEISRQIHRLDASLLASSMLEVAPGFSILAAPEDPSHANDVKPEHVDLIIKLVRRHYDFVILDVGRTLDAVSIHALDHADLIFPVLQTTLPYIRDGKRLLTLFRSLDYRKDKIQLIVNRHEKNGDIKLRDVEDVFGVNDIRTIPNHYDAAAASVNQGVPILKLAKSSPVSKALLEFAHTLAGSSDGASTGWLSRVFKRATVVQPIQQHVERTTT